MVVAIALVVLGVGYLLGSSSQRREDAKNLAKNLLDDHRKNRRR